jgi:hypothetical protein
MNRTTIFIQIVFLLTLFYCESQAQNDMTYKELGTVKTKSSNEIKTSRWSIGGETLDRNYASYEAYKKYLGPLGAKRIRLQGGWAKCEKVKGQYDFEWLDNIVDDALSQGVSPWIQPSYGNPIYEGGGQPVLVDLFSGKVFQLPKDKVSFKNGRLGLKGIPATDSPMAIIDRSWITFK